MDDEFQAAKEKLEAALDRECRTRIACKKRSMETGKRVHLCREAIKRVKTARTMKKHCKLMENHEDFLPQ